MHELANPEVYLEPRVVGHQTLEHEVHRTSLGAVSVGSDLQEADFSFDFAAFEEDLDGFIDLEEQAVQAFAGFFTFETSEEGERRTVADIRSDALIFFANPMVIQMELDIERLARIAHDFCQHNGVEPSQIGLDGLVGVLGAEHSADDRHGHEHDKKESDVEHARGCSSKRTGSCDCKDEK